MSAAQCRNLAKKIGCTLEVQGRRKAHITIWLPEGKQVVGNAGLDCLCNDAETPTEAWPLVLVDLQNLAAGGMEDRSQ